MTSDDAITAEPPKGPVLYMIGAIAWPLLRLLVFQTVCQVMLSQLPAPAAAAGVLVATWLFLRRYGICRQPRRLRELAAVRLRPLRDHRGWLVAVFFGLVLIDVGWIVLLVRWLGLPPPEANAAAASASSATLGLLATAVDMVVATPIVEELVFRGWILRRLESRFGALRALVGSAILFALLHPAFVGFPDRLAHGLVLPMVVFVTGSLWAAILLHAAANLLVVAIDQGVSEAQLMALAAHPSSVAIAIGGCLAGIALLMTLARPFLRTIREKNATRPAASAGALP